MEPVVTLSMQEARRAGGRRRMTALIFGGVALGLVGVSFAAVPLYDFFCQVTGYGGTTQRSGAADGRILDRMVRVQFDSNVADTLGWRFLPGQRNVDLRLGETALVEYTVANLTGAPTAGTAVFNVTPEAAGRYFSKVECFCFTVQTLGAGETAVLPVLFFVDPAIADDPILNYIDTITLSYTFYPTALPEPRPVAQAAGGAAG